MADVRPSYAHDPKRHAPGTPGARGECSHHLRESGDCSGAAVVSFEDASGALQSGCALALEQLVAREDIAPLGQGA